MSLDTGDGSLDNKIGKSVKSFEYLIVSKNSGTIWGFDQLSKVKSFFVGRNIKTYKLYRKDEDKKDNIETAIYGENGQYS